MNKLLTILVPTYNMQYYLKVGLNSLLVDDEQMKLFEVLVINDGSKDNSSVIAHEYETNYPETFRVIDKENGNYGSCVNRGLKEARGKYIKLLDADDWFDTVEFVSFLKKLKNMEEVDMVMTDYKKVSSQGEVLADFRYMLNYGIVYPFQKLDNMEYFANPSITYRTQLLLDIQYYQSEGISYTDNQWMYYPQLYVKNAMYIDNNVYRYFVGREGQSMDPQVKLRNCKQVISLLMNMINYASDLADDIKVGFSYKRLESFIIHSSKGVYKDLLVNMDTESFDPDILELYDRFLFKERKDIYDLVDRELKLKVVPIHYVKYWRKYGKRFPVDWFRETYRSFRYRK